MGQQIGQIPTHNTAPGGSNKIETENPVGPTSEYSTIAEMLAANVDLTKTTTQRDALSPSTNMHIYNSTTGQPEWYDSNAGVWRSFLGDISPGASNQMGGFTAANIAEVESATKAARTTFRPTDYNDGAWDIGRYKVSPIVGLLNVGLSAGVALNNGAEILAFAWVREGVAIIRKVTASFCSGQVSGVRAGICNVQMFITRSNVGLAAGVYLSPPDQVNISGHGNPGEVVNQPPSQAFVSFTVAPASGTQLGTHVLDPQPIGIAEAGITSAAGQTPINDAVLYDHQVAEQPLVLGIFCGFVVTLTCPSAVTSQTIGWNVNIEWDEYTPSSPGDH